MEAVKTFLTAVKLHGASVHTADVTAVCDALTDNCFSEAALKAFFKHTAHLASHYPNSGHTRAALFRLFARLQATNPAAVQHCSLFCQELDRFYASSARASQSYLHETVFSLRCLSAVLTACSSDTSLAHCQPALASVAALLQAHYLATKASMRAAFRRVAYRLFGLPWLRARCLELVSSQSPTAGLVGLCSLLADYLHSNSLTGEIVDKSALLKHCLQTCFVTKEPASALHLDSSRRLVQLLVDRQLFAAELLPLINKAVLRSPEVALPAVSSCLSSLSIDLSQHSSSLLDTLAAHLRAESDAVRCGAVACIAQLAGQVADARQFAVLVGRLCRLLLGSEGKLTNPKHKLSLLAACSALPTAAPSDEAKRECSGQLAAALVTFLGQEAHEAITLEALCQLRACLHKIDAKDQRAIVTALQDGLAKKLSPQQRLYHLWCLRSAFVGHPIAGSGLQTGPLKDALTRAASAAATAASGGLFKWPLPPPTLQALAESLPACELALRLHAEGGAPADLLDAAMALCAATTGAQQPALLSNALARAIGCSEALARCCLPSALAVVDALLCDHPGLSNEAMCAFLAHLAASPDYAGVRSEAMRCVRRHLQGLSGVSAARAILVALNRLLNSAADAPPGAAAPPADAGQQDSAPPAAADTAAASSDDESSAGSPAAGSLALHDLLTAFDGLGQLHSGDVADADDLPALLLLPCHHASVRSHRQLWRRLLVRLFGGGAANGSGRQHQQHQEQLPPLQPAELLRRCFEPVLAGELSPRLHHRRAVATLTAECPGFADCLASRIVSCLTAPDVAALTLREVAILRVPDGVVSDTVALDTAAEKLRLELDCGGLDGSASEAGASNVRRENRLYSYADQMAELELRRELANKKGDRELQRRLADAMAEQLAAERSERERLAPLERRVDACFQLLHCLVDAFVQAGPSLATTAGSRALLHELLSCTAGLLAHPLTADRAVAAFERLATAPGWCLPPGASGRGLLYSRALFAACSPAVLSAAPRPDWSGGPALLDAALRALQGEAAEQALAAGLPLLRCVLLHSDGGPCCPERCGLAVTAAARYCQAEAPERLPLGHLLPVLAGHLPASRDALLLLCQRCGNRLTADCVQSLLSCITGTDDPLAVQTALECLSGASLPQEPTSQLLTAVARHVHLARRHPSPDVATCAEAVWRRHCAELQTSADSADLLAAFHLRCLASPRPAVREAAGAALAAIAEAGGPAASEHLLEQLLALYKELAQRSPAEFDQFGRLLRERPPDRWEARVAGVAALERLLPTLGPTSARPLFSALVDSLLRDEAPQVRDAAQRLGQRAVELHGRENLNELTALFEHFLESAPAVAALDSVRQGVVVLLGQLARYLDPEADQARICRIFGRLLDTLDIPSQSVQAAVSACLPPLMPAMRKDKEVIVEKLMRQALESDAYAKRKGAAYGLAGVTKGLGIAVLKEMQVNQRLLEAMKDKKSPQRREGALMALEQICLAWGRLFEPYVVSILPSLLICCGDSVTCVRQAADECSIAVMSKLSNHGVKLVLPSLLSTLAEDNWRTKCASVDLLGSMSYCAPKQLSACLPQIVPKLMEVLTDSHVRVQKSGEEALAKIGKVITNREIRDIVPHLLDSIRDPEANTNAALQQLLSIQFVHKIDTASLALIMPVVGRAFRDPTTETRKTAALIVGSIYRLTERADLTPYMEGLMPGLKKCLLDPVPDVRAVAGKALGSMVREMGEPSFQDMFPWLMATLVSEDSPINRAGAAQGLSEMIGGMGGAKLESLMPEIISTAKQPDIAPHVRDGYLLMFVYLPRVFQAEFSQYVSATLPAILNGLANEIEFVRETALKAGQTLVQQYSDMAITLLLPELEVGLFDDNWRIRYSSVQLLGDLLYKLSGASGRGTTVSANDDDTMGSSSEFARIGNQLGEERRNRVLAALYVSRSDSALLVRQASCHVWKVVVPHTPRTLQAILPTLLPMLLGNLASASADMREVSARTLGDIVRKLGERVLQQLMVMLQNGLDSDDEKQREGVCLALSEIMRSMPRDHMQAYGDQLVPTVRRALADPLPSVRAAASRTFDQLYGVLGQRALDDVVLRLQADLDSGACACPESALDGLKQAVAVRSDVVLPYLVPRLTQEPVNTGTLAILASVAGSALTPHLPRILPALLGALKPDSEDQMAQCRGVVQSIRDEAGVQLAIRHLTSSELTNQPLNYRLGAARLLQTLAQRDDAGRLLADHSDAVLRACFRHYCAPDERLIEAAHSCLAALTARCATPAEMVVAIRTALRHVLSEPQHRAGVTLVPGFCSQQPRGIQPLLGVYREGLLNGQVEQKEAAALGLKELVERTSGEALKASVVSIAGPLIRVLGDRYAAQLKCAVIDALTALLGRCGAGLKAFLPQLQLTLFKALADPAQSLRSRAALAIGELASVHAKPDQMVSELLAALAKPDACQSALLSALRQWCHRAGPALSPAACESVLTAVRQGRLCAAEDETVRACAGACVGLVAAACPRVADAAVGGQAAFLRSGGPEAWQEWQARLGGLVAFLGAASAEDVTARLADVEAAVLAAIASDRPQVVDAGVRCIGAALAKAPQAAGLISALIRAQKHENTDVKLLASLATSHACEALPDDQVTGHLARQLLPMLANGTRERNSGVKAASEQAIADMCRLYRADEAQRLAAACLDKLEPAMRDSVGQIIDRLARKQWQRTAVCLDRTAAR